jgi:flagellar assembly protein FliH
MTRTLQLEDFGTGPAPGSNAVAAEVPPEPELEPLPEAGLEGGNLDAFEQGYRSGWDDCTANEVEERRRVGADLATALAEISLTLDAARDEMIAALEPLFEQIVAQLLPAIVAEAVAPLAVTELRRIADERCAARVEVLASPATCPIIENLVDATPDLEVSVIPEQALAEGQVSLRFDAQRRDVDLSLAAAQMAEAIRSFTTGMVADSSDPTVPATDSAAAEPPIQKGVA